MNNNFMLSNYHNLSLGSFFLFLNYYFFMPVLPLYLTKWTDNNLIIGMITGTAAFAAFIFQPITGYVSDIKGRMTLIRTSSLLFIFAPLIYIFSNSYFFLLLGRFLHGIGMAGFWISANAYIADVTEPSLLRRAYSYYSIFVNVAIGIAPAIGSRLYSQYGFSLKTILVPLVASLLALTFFGSLQDSKKEPVAHQQHPGFGLQLKTALKERIVIPLFISYCSIFALGTVLIFLPLYAHSLEIKEVGSYYLFYMASLVISRIILGTFLPNAGKVKIILFAEAFIVLALIVLGHYCNFTFFIFSAILFGAGIGLLMPTLTAMVGEKTTWENRGTELGIFSLAFDLGMSTGAFAMGMISNYVSYSQTFFITALLPFLSIIIFLRFKNDCI